MGMERHTLANAIRALASVCDGAASLDGAGFNGMDSKFGKRLAQLPPDLWTPAMRREAWEMLAKYRRQLAAFGIVYDIIPEPPPVDADIQAEARQEARRRLNAHRAGRAIGDQDADRTRRISYGPGPAGRPVFIVRFPYDPALVAEMRGVPGRRWYRAEKVNIVPATAYSARALAEFAERHDFTWDDEARAQLASLLATPEGEETSLPEPAPHGVTYDEATNRFVVAFPYASDMVDALKRQIPARVWDSDRNAWLILADPTSCQALERFAKAYALPISTDAWGRLRGVTEEMRERLEASRAAAAELEVEGLGGTLRPFQAAGVAYALRSRRCFIADEMGLGKTVQALASIQAANAYPAVIVCPASLKLNWQREARKWLPGRRVLVVDSRTPAGQIECADVLIVNYDILKVRPKPGAENKTRVTARDLEPEGVLAYLIARRPRALVLDESHYAKNPKARRTMACLALAREIPADGLRLLLSGTPLLNRPAELIAQLRILGRLEDLGGYSYFTRTYCRAMDTAYGRDISGHGSLAELNERLRATCFVRRLKRDVLTELPPKQRSIVPLELSNRAEYERAERDLIAWLVDTARDEEEADAKVLAALRAEQLVRLNALKKLAAQGKLAEALKWIRNFLDSGEKLIVFAHHREVVHQVAGAFACPVITGDTPVPARQEAVDRFQTDPDCRLIALNLQAGGVGLTLTAASHVAFLELGWTPAIHDQAEDRAHRIGQEASSVNAWYLLAERSIDEEIYNLIEEKRAIVTAAADGDVAEQQQSMAAEVIARLRKQHATL